MECVRNVTFIPNSAGQLPLHLLQTICLLTVLSHHTVRRRWTALARSGYLIRDLTNPCQPTAYLCPKAEDGNRRKNVLQRARQRTFEIAAAEMALWRTDCRCESKCLRSGRHNP